MNSGTSKSFRNITQKCRITSLLILEGNPQRPTFATTVAIKVTLVGIALERIYLDRASTK